MAGIIGLVLLVLFEAITVNNESEYYVLKEAMEAAMLESVDKLCYRYTQENTSDDANTGCGDNDIKISEQKFVENFTRRFAASINGDVSEYKLEFYDIMEKPPKATVVVRGKTQKYAVMSVGGGDDTSFDLVNNLSGILELREEKKK